MPRKPVDYSKTIIYKIVCKDLLITKCYVGHTTDFTNRKRQHKQNCNNKNQLYVYIFINENGGFENFDMIEIEKYPCLDVNEARKQERYWIETLNAELNQFMPSRTKKEYYNENIEYILEQKKNYYEQNKISILEQRKQYRDQHIEEKKEYMKKWCEQNKEQKKLYNKNRYEQNKDEINKKRREQRALKKQQSAKECV